MFRELAGQRVLVLEAHHMLARTLQELLEGAGAEVIGPFRDAATAIARADQEKPNCAVVDIDLDDGPSFTPAKALLGRNIAVVLLTGYDRDVLSLDMPRVIHLQKPASSDQIVKAVQAAIRASKADAANHRVR